MTRAGLILRTVCPILPLSGVGDRQQTTATKGETMRIISIETKTVAGREYNVIKGYSEKSISKRQYQSDVEGYGSELVHFVKKGELYDIIIAL